MVDAALRAIEQHRMVEPGDLVLVAVSGGADSTCLLDVLARASERLQLSLAVAHVDHGLAPASGAAAARVAHAAARAGFDVHLGRAPDLSGPNLQARARAFRYAFLTDLAHQIGAARIATGHTLDDRVETLLARLLHGAGTDVLAGIPPVEGPRIRPLIDVRRPETRAYCEARGLEFDEDPANDDVRFERVRIRKLLLESVERAWGAGTIRAMAESARRLREDSEALRTLAERVYPGIATSADNVVSIDLPGLVALPPGLRRRIVERAVGRVRDRAGGVDAALRALDRPRARTLQFEVAAGIVIEISSDRVTVRGAQGSAADDYAGRTGADDT